MRLARSCARVLFRRGIFRPRFGWGFGTSAGALTGAVGLHKEGNAPASRMGGVGLPAGSSPDHRAVGNQARTQIRSSPRDQTHAGHGAFIVCAPVKRQV